MMASVEEITAFGLEDKIGDVSLFITSASVFISMDNDDFKGVSILDKLNPMAG